MKKYGLFFLFTTMSSLIFCGCGKSDVSEPLEDIVQTITVEQTLEILSALPENKEALYAMSLEEFKEMVKTNIPNYRNHFKVPEDYVLEDSDWESFREILSIELFGSSLLENEGNAVQTSEIPEQEDPNKKYSEPSAEYVNSLSDEEFVAYLSELQAYLYPESEPADYSKLTSEELAQVKAVLLQNEDVSGKVGEENEVTKN